MKRIYLSLLMTAAAIAAAVSCNKDDSSAAQQPAADGMVNLKVAITAPVTKATVAGTDAENTVSNIQIFVFKLNGSDYVYEASAKANDDELNITVTSGTKTVLALVNEDTDYTAQQDYEDILAMVTSFKDNARNDFRMVGTKEQLVDATHTTVAVPVNRVAARIRVNSITNNLLNGFDDDDVKVVRAYLTHVADNTDYTCVLANTGWYAEDGINTQLDHAGAAVSVAAEKSAVNDLVYQALATPADLASAASYAPAGGAFVLYAYPHDGSVKKTHLTVEMEIGGKDYTYVIELPALLSNHSYEINDLVLRNLGNPSDGDDVIEDEEDNPITPVEATFSVEVQPWELTVLANPSVPGGADGKWTI